MANISFRGNEHLKRFFFSLSKRRRKVISRLYLLNPLYAMRFLSEKYYYNNDYEKDHSIEIVNSKSSKRKRRGKKKPDSNFLKIPQNLYNRF